MKITITEDHIKRARAGGEGCVLMVAIKDHTGRPAGVSFTGWYFLDQDPVKVRSYALYPDAIRVREDFDYGRIVVPCVVSIQGEGEPGWRDVV